MNLGLENKIIIVTGGARGIGEGIVRVLTAEGAIPVIVGRNAADNMKLQEEIQQTGRPAFSVQAELSDPAACETTVAAVVEKFGRIEGLVNNAGVNDGVGLEKGNYELFMKSLHNNLIHYYLMAHFALPYSEKIPGCNCEYQFENSRNRAGQYFGLCCCQRRAERTDPRMGC